MVVKRELTVANIEQYYYEVRPKNKEEVLSRLLDIYNPALSVVFCNTKRQVDELVEGLKGRGYFAEGLHGDMKQQQRDRVMNGFRNGRTEILVATDVAARGIDVDDVDAVFNYDLPQDDEYYVHRTYDLSSDTSKAGCIFMDYRMADDFSSPYSIIYGHNVRDGSMLSDLARLKDQTLYDEEPYFWILTPEGNYRYQIFSIFQCHRAADVFQRSFDGWGEDFSKWQSELKLRNSMQGDVKLREDGHVIAFSTCVPNSFDRTIVCGIYIDGDLITDPHEENEIEKKQLK